MSRIEKLSIRGIRSFDPKDEVKIEFFHPLTLIQGHNGSGKTTVIECLKMATCGSLPPLATNGKTFICDPKISGSNEVKASIKLKFLTPRNKEVLVIRNFQLTSKSNKMEFKRLEQLLKSNNSAGQSVTINSTCVDIDKQVPLLMHSSKAILENVIFCHQEETNWPFSEAGNLKKVFDEIFDTAKYTKALEELKDVNKSFNSRAKEYKQSIELLSKDFDHFKKISAQIETNEKKISDITGQLQELSQEIEKTEKDLNEVNQYEERAKFYKNKFDMLKVEIKEKYKQIENIKNDKYFVNYTDDENKYNEYMKSYEEKKNNSSFEKIQNLKNNIEKFKEEKKVLENELHQINFKILTHNENMKEIQELFNETKALCNSLNIEYEDNDNSAILFKRVEIHEEMIKSKSNEIEDKRSSFDNKMREKLSESEVNEKLLLTKIIEIQNLLKKKEELNQYLDSNEITNELTRIETLIENTKEKLITKENKELRTVDHNLKILENYNLEDFNEIQNNLVKLEDEFKTINSLMNTYDQIQKNEIEHKQIITKFNKKFNNNLTEINKIKEFLNNKRNQIDQDKDNVRDKYYFIIKSLESNRTKIEELQIENTSKLTKITELENKLQNYSVQLDLNISEIKNFEYSSKILNFKEELDKLCKNLKNQISLVESEMKFIKDYIHSLYETDECVFCLKKVEEHSKAEIDKHMTDKYDVLNEELGNKQAIFRQKQESLDKLIEIEPILNEIQTINDEIIKNKTKIEEIELENETLEKNKSTIEYSSKQKLKSIEELNEINVDKLTENNLMRESLGSKLKKGLNKLNIIREDCSELFFEERRKVLKDQISLYQEKKMEYEINLKEKERLKTTKEQLLEDINSLNSILRKFEQDKKNLTSKQSDSEIKRRIEELNQEIEQKQAEKSNLEGNKERLIENQSMIGLKKEQFDSIYNDKKQQYQLEFENIQKLKNQISFLNKRQESLRATLGNEDVDFMQLKRDKEHTISLLDQEINKIQENLKFYEDDINNQIINENNYNNNKNLYELNNRVKELLVEINNYNEDPSILQRALAARVKIQTSNQELRKNFNMNQGKLSEINQNQAKLKSEQKMSQYIDIEKRYNKAKVDFALTIETIKYIESYYESLDQSLLKYHAKRMEEINKLINYYWGMTYKGTDIKYIEIKSDVEKTARSRTYNYRIIFGTSGDHELDMRGRCSAGQKVLASIIIRLALAETFCNNCGILCLDEPTTNLDEEHISSLAMALREIITARSEDNNFQLIVITHDPKFVELLGTDFSDSYWMVSKNKQNFSNIQLRPINSLFKS